MPRRAHHPALRCLWSLVSASSLLLGACAERLPDDVRNYETECLLMNATPLLERSDDPHRGSKNVYGCNATHAELSLRARPFADGIIIVKEARRADADFIWLISTARKVNGGWQWDEYTRNFEDEDFVHIIAGEGPCIDCHRDVSQPLFDWIFTPCNVPECTSSAQDAP